MSSRKVYPLSKRISSQVHGLQRLLSLCNEHPDIPGFTLDNILKWPVFKLRNTSHNSMDHAMKRFVKLNIVSSPGHNTSGKMLYRVKNIQWAIAYIENDPDKPWIPLTPTPRPDQFADYDEHRPHFAVSLTTDWFARIRGICTTNNGQCTLRTKSFTLSVNSKSLKGQIFLRPYWREDIKKKIGEDFYQYIAALESKGAMRGDFCLPLDVKGQRFYVGGRPTQISASHYEAQLDVRASQGDQHIRDGLAALINQADFNTRTLDFEDAVFETLKKQGEVQSKIAESLQKIVKQFFPETDPTYRPPPEDEGGFQYQ